MYGKFMTQGYCYVFTPGCPYINTADGISGSETPLHPCMSQNERKNHKFTQPDPSNSHDAIWDNR